LLLGIRLLLEENEKKSAGGFFKKQMVTKCFNRATSGYAQPKKLMLK